MTERSLRPLGASTESGPVPSLVTRLVALGRSKAFELRQRWLGGDFDERVSLLQERYSGARFDPLGLDLLAFERAARITAFFHRAYFRTEVHGIDNLPEGRMLIVANHSGQIPIDAAILGATLFFDAAEPRVLRAMIDRWAGELPFVSTFFARLGSIVGSRSNAERLLQRNEAVLVFPEGMRGISKPFPRRYRLLPFSHGFIRIALATETPIVPCAVVGAEEQYVSIGTSRTLARLLGVPVFPLVPQMLLPLGQLPLPTKYRIHFGEPLRFAGRADEPESRIAHKVFMVEKAVQALLDEGLRRRRGIFA